MRHKSFHLTSAALVCLCLSFAGYSRAGTSDAYVSSTGDSGTGTLRQAVTDTNALGGGDILWTQGGGGGITLASSLDSITGGTLLDVTAATTSVTISGYYMPLGGAVTLRNNNASTTWTIASSLSGSGSLTKTGAGNLTLTGSNSYTGGTFLDEGTLSVGADENLGASSGGLTFDGGTLQNYAGFSSARVVTLNSGGGTFDTNSYDLWLTSSVTGTGALAKKGLGTLYLTGNNTYSGGTTVSSGTVALGANNALGSGALAVSSDGTVDLGGYSQTLASYANSGTLKLKLQSGVTNMTVTGAAQLGGALSVAVVPYLYQNGDTFTPISAGSLTGTFSSILSPAALAFNPTYTGTGLTLTVSLVPFVNSAVTANQSAIAASLEPLRVLPSGDLATVISNLYTLDTARLQNALDQTGPSSYSSMRGIVRGAQDLQSSVLYRRSAVLAAPDYTGGYSASAISGEDSVPSSSGAAGGFVVSNVGSSSPLGYFVTPVGGGGSVIKSDDSPAYTFYDGGMLAGADYKLGGHAAVGLMGGYIYGKSRVTYPQSAQVENNSARYGAYAVGNTDALHLFVYAGKAADSFTANRSISFGEINRSAKASPKGDETNLYAAASYDLQTTAGGILSPLAELNYDKLVVDGFTESGADALNLAVSRQSAQSLRSNLGVKYADKSDMGEYSLGAACALGWLHEFRSPDSMEAALVSGGSPFTVNTGSLGRNGLRAQLGVTVTWLNQTVLSIDYSGDFRSELTTHLVSAGLHVKF